MKYKIAVIGATGNVGLEMINILSERGFALDYVTAIASKNSYGKELECGEHKLKCEMIDRVDFSKIDFVLMSAGAAISQKWAPVIASLNTVVVDNSSFFRMQKDVPLIVPEVNADVLDKYFLQKNRRNIIANPNCSTAQLAVVLKPLHDFAKIERVVVATYQSVSGAGSKATKELLEQTRSIYNNNLKQSEHFTKQIAFNVIPQIDVFLENGYTKEEWKMEVEIGKIVDQNIKLTSTAVRVPVFVGHSEAVNIAFKKPITPSQARDLLAKAPGCIVIDKPEKAEYITPIDCVGNYATYISRIRHDKTIENGLNLWIVSDNLRKGAALNSVQILETIINRKLLPVKKNDNISRAS